MRAALREELAPVEGVEILLDEPAHQVGGVGGVDSLAVAALEAVAVEERHEELEVVLVPVVGRGGHEEEVSASFAERLAQPVALGELHFAAQVVGAHAVGLVADDEVPLRSGPELFLNVLVPRELIEAGDEQVLLLERVRRPRGLDHVAGEKVEVEIEFLVQLVLPLLGNAAGRDDEAALEVAPDDQFLDEEPGHDGLAGARIVGEEEPHRLTREHLLVHRADLVGERIDRGRRDRDVRVEEPGEVNPVGL